MYKRKIKKMTKTWTVVLIFTFIGLTYINNSFKYKDYYQNRGEYKNRHLNLYVMIDDVEKITKNRKIYIEEEKFAYKVSSISKDNIYSNGNYYKEVSLIIDKDFIDNEIIDIKIVNCEYSLLEYVFKTVWR